MTQVLRKLTGQVLRNNNVECLFGAYHSLRVRSTWENVPMGPPDVILGITEAYKRDSDPNKVNLGVGAYRHDDGQPWILPCVRKVMYQLFTPSLFNILEAYRNDPEFTWWGDVPMGPPDVILGISEAYKRDTHPKKVNLGVGAYRDDDGNPWILPSVKKAEEIIAAKGLNHEYAPISGDAEYTDAVAKLAFGEGSVALRDKTNCTVQSLSGTGALRLGLDFIAKFYTRNKEIWFPNPTWGNHPQLANTVRLPFKKYRYYDPNTNGFDLQGCLEDISIIPEGSVIMFHACAHNPTGVDPKRDEWKQISEVVMRRNLMPFFDMAYQGFATGDVDNDAFAVRLFADEGHQLLLAQSFAKNMGLYGERVGALTLMCGNAEAAQKVMSQLKIMIRTMYSNPPLFGARLVKEILTNNQLKQQWLVDVKKMADRIITMRQKLRSGIEGAGNTGRWTHITDQIGMFCYTGLKPHEVTRLTNDFHIYLTKDGRISVAGISSKNVQYVAECMHKVTTPEVSATS